MGLSF
ncbi:HAD hydrolase, IA, variant 3 family protein, partial [Vibrio parahaemolyticus AQ3810]